MLSLFLKIHPYLQYLIEKRIINILKIKETSIMITEIPYSFDGKIFRSPMPFSSYDHKQETWALYLKNKINIIVLLTEKHEYLIHAGRDLIRLYKDNDIEVIHYPIKDYHIPEDRTGLDQVINQVILETDHKKNIAIHCMAGLGRTGIFLACLAKRQFNMTGKESISWVRQFVPNALENPLQESFVVDF
jgi:protein-tyrosine phosphatase